MCGAEFHDPQSIRCPRCPCENPKDAVHCVACDAVLQPNEWSCTVCEGSDFDGWLECANGRWHRACFDCQTSWINSCDADGREPTCLTCDAEGLADRRLSEASIQLILGEEAYSLRSARLAERACRLYYCTTAGCKQMFELDSGVAERSTTCPTCKKSVTLRRTTDAELIGQCVVRGTRTASDAFTAQGADAAQAAGTSADAAIDCDEEENEDAAAAEARRARETAAQVRELLGEVKSCPKCGFTFSKTPQSCNKFKCHCGHRWCWVCEAEPDAQGRLPCKCPKTGDEHDFYEPVHTYRPRKRPRAESR